VFQDRFAVPSKWFHSAGFWPAFVPDFRDEAHRSGGAATGAAATESKNLNGNNRKEEGEAFG